MGLKELLTKINFCLHREKVINTEDINEETITNTEDILFTAEFCNNK